MRDTYGVSSEHGLDLHGAHRVREWLESEVDGCSALRVEGCAEMFRKTDYLALPDRSKAILGH